MKTKPWFDRFVERVLGKRRAAGTPPGPAAGTAALPEEPERGVMDGHANDKALAEAAPDTPLYKALMDHAYDLAGGFLTSAFDEKAPASERLANLDRVAGLRVYIGNVEETRRKLLIAKVKAQEREAAIAAAREARAKRSQQR